MSRFGTPPSSVSSGTDPAPRADWRTLFLTLDPAWPTISGADLRNWQNAVAASAIGPVATASVTAAVETPPAPVTAYALTERAARQRLAPGADGCRRRPARSGRGPRRAAPRDRRFRPERDRSRTPGAGRVGRGASADGPADRGPAQYRGFGRGSPRGGGALLSQPPTVARRAGGTSVGTRRARRQSPRRLTPSGSVRARKRHNSRRWRDRRRCTSFPTARPGPARHPTRSTRCARSRGTPSSCS